MTSAGSDAGAAQALRRYIYGDVPLDEWTPSRGDAASPPWDAFARARQLARQGEVGQATEIWWQIASSAAVETRQTLQAWHFLREAGRQPPTARAKVVLGTVIEMPAGGGHDLLAAYKDGSARYLNYSGKAAIVEDRSITEIQEAVHRWIEIGQVIAQAIGPIKGSTFPPLGPGEIRVMMLTPSGPHFGQGPAPALTADRMAGAFIAAATKLMQLIVARSLT
jgi:hypothetical protein